MMTALDNGTVDLATLAPLDHTEGLDLFAAELQRNLDLMVTLTPGEWSTQTECPDWDVRRMYLHVLGANESGASIRELAHQFRSALVDRRRNGTTLEAALSAAQVADRIDLTSEQLVVRYALVAPKVVRKRRGLPALLRKATMKVDAPVVERWSLGYLVDTIYLRDAWMHRIDVCRAVGREPMLTREHDGRIVADVAAEWARRHGQPVSLVLTGPAGGVYRAGSSSAAAPRIELDAVEFCRILAGRAPGDGLLTTIVPF